MKNNKPKPKAQPKPKSNHFMLNDKEQKANEQQAAYENTGAFGIGMVKGK